MIRRTHTRVTAFLFVLIALVSFAKAAEPTALQILADHCFECHGPDEEARKGKLRLDTFEGATASSVVVGDPDSSELIARMLSTDPDERMPPPPLHKALPDDQIATIKAWIKDGAPYETHWAFLPPERPDLPTGTEPKTHPIDAFVRARLKSEGVIPAPPAAPATLVRRLYLDLIGMPPTPEQADAYLREHAASPHATERLIDQLLASPHYGERWARPWLDLARYADTNGYEKDRERSIWPYRDWVIKALNDDMSYAQFTVEQLAGDMLPDSTRAQRVATGFHRNTMLNEEGGIDPLEYRFYAMVDRVATTGTAWMGLTIGCAQCHTHKYDPIQHTDYYRMMALLNNTEEPDLAVPGSAHEAAAEQHSARRSATENRLIAAIDAEAFAAWLKLAQAESSEWTILRPHHMEAGLTKLSHQADGSIFATGDGTKRDVYTLQVKLDQPASALRLEVLPDERLPVGGPGRTYYEGRKGDFFLSELTVNSVTPAGQTNAHPFADGSMSYGKINIGSGKASPAAVFDGDGSSGWSTAGQNGRANQLVLNFKNPLPAGESTIEMLFERHFTTSLGRFRLATSAERATAKSWPAEIERQLAAATAAKPTRDLKLAFLGTLSEPKKQMEALARQAPKPPSTMVFTERPADHPRPTARHHRGEYLSPRELVSPGVPEIFPQLGNDANRLTFARWLTSTDNPLGSRVAVNRAWHALFGRGIVASVDDFGVLGGRPSHPELLDWLATEFDAMEGSMKSLHRLITTSETYQQSSRPAAPEMLRSDPYNTMLARGPRFRVDGETVRDIMLTASGVLHPKLGGPSVKPPQPASVTGIAYGGTKWVAATGPERYRRSLYTHSKRTAPFAAYTTFDAPTGETCIAKRDRSNTPLQALTLLNDDMFLEMARALASHIEAASEENPVTTVFRRFLTRAPSAAEHAQLSAYLEAQLTRTESGALKAADICKDRSATARQAALVLLVRVVMNLDETVTKE